MRSLRTLALVFLLPCGATEAADIGITACVYGFVENRSGVRIADARVIINSPGISGSLTRISNASGQFCFSAIRPADLTLFAEAPGYRTERDTLISVKARFRVPLLLVVTPVENPAFHVSDAERTRSQDELLSCQCGSELRALSDGLPRTE